MQQQNIMVVGATGRTGSRIVKQLSSANDAVNIRCLVREESKSKAAGQFQGLRGVETVGMNDLIGADSADIAKTMAGCDTVVCALGALESEALNYKAPYLIDGQLSQKMIDAAVLTGTVKNFILISSLGTDRFGWPASILNLFWGVLSWKRQTELKLISSGLKYTIIRPGGMEKPTDEFELTHNMKIHRPSTQFGGQISRKQIASLCVEAVTHPDLASGRILEVTADPQYPKLSPLALLEGLPKTTSESDWRSKLTPSQYYVLREAGTERPWTSELNEEKRPGVFTCAGCGSDLFPSTTKFESGTGWPSFFAPAGKGAVDERLDFMFGISRTEVLCSTCGGHLGHVFPDGPRPTGQRYCINGVALAFTPAEDIAANENEAADQRKKLASRLD
jgi:peptide-methionine (R)-S-oxide reductase